VSFLTSFEGPKVILVNGLAGAGKSETYKYYSSPAFQANRPQIRLVKFAGTLKRMIGVLLEDAGLAPDVIERLIEGSQDDKMTPIPELRGVTSRHMMKMLGSEWRDTIYAELWADLSDLKAAKTFEDGCRALYDDLRFEHEMTHVIGKYGRENVAFIQIQGPDFDKTKDADQHQSERPMDEALFDAVIRNHGSLQDLHRMLDQVERDLYALGVDNGPRIYSPDTVCAAA
jgi:hypothetical protein